GIRLVEGFGRADLFGHRHLLSMADDSETSNQNHVHYLGTRVLVPHLCNQEVCSLVLSAVDLPDALGAGVRVDQEYLPPIDDVTVHGSCCRCSAVSDSRSDWQG